MSTAKVAQDDDIASNETAIKAAETKSSYDSLVTSFLGGDNYDDDKDAPTDEVQEALWEGFMEDNGGINFTRNKMDEQNTAQVRGVDAATERLRKQMLGRRVQSRHANKSNPGAVASKQVQAAAKRKGKVDVEGEETRSGAAKKRSGGSYLDQVLAQRCKKKKKREAID